MRLRLLTINTGKGDGPYARRVAILADAIAALEPDVVLCQEAFETDDGEHSTARTIAGRLGLDLAALPLRHKPRVVEGRTVRSCSGLATLSRHPLTEETPLRLTSAAADGERAALLVAVETPAGLVRVGNTHLTHLRDRDDLRVQQVGEVLAASWWDGAAVARIVGGDLNAPPGHAVHDAITVRGGRDLHQAGAAGDPAPTIRFERGGILVESRVDYLYALDGPGAATAPSVASAGVVLTEAVEGILPSDHFGVLVDLDL